MKKSYLTLSILATLTISISYADFEVRYYDQPNIKFINKPENELPAPVVPEPNIIYFKSNINRLDVNSQLTLDWETTNANEIFIKSNLNTDKTTNSFAKINNNNLVVYPTEVGSYVFTIKAINKDGKSVESTIDVQSEKIEPIPTIESFNSNLTEVTANSSFNLNWSITDAKEVLIKSNIATTNTSTEFTKVTGNLLSITPTTQGTYTFTIKAVNSKGESVEETISIEVVPVKFSGIFTLSQNIPATTTDLLIWPNTGDFSASITNIPSGDVTALSIVFANYVNKSTYKLTLTACVNAKCVSSPAYDTLKMLDNKFNVFTLNEKLYLPANGKIDYKLSIVKNGTASYAPVFYKFIKTPAGISNYVTTTSRSGTSTGYYTDVKVHYDGK